MSENLFLFSPVANWVRSKPKGQYGLQLPGSLDMIAGGDFTSVDMTPTTEETDIWSNETPYPTLAMTDYGTPDITVDIAARTLVSDFRHMLYWSQPDLVLTQLLAADQTFTFAAMTGKGNRRRLPHRDVTIDSVTGEDVGGDPVDYVRNVNYRVSKATGWVEITSHPAGVIAVDGKADVTVAYDAAAITGRSMFGMMSNVNLRCGFNFISTNQWGHKQEVDAWDCQAKFDKIPLGADGNEFIDYALKLRVFPDPTKAAGLEYVRIVDIPRE